MRSWMILALVACGGSNEDAVLQQELEAEAAAGDEDTEGGEITMADRYRAADSRVFEACYDDLDHLDERHRARRSLRVRRISEQQAQATTPTGLEVERENGTDDATTELPSNVDNTNAHGDYHPIEQRLIALEDQLDQFHAAHPDVDAWSDAELSRYEDLADGLHAQCTQMRSEA